MYEDYNQKNEWVKDETKDWESLSDNKCPLCGLGLIAKLIATWPYYICTCGFQITEDRFNKITNELQSHRLSAKERKLLAEGKKVKFKPQKTFTGERPKYNPINF